MSHRVIVLEKTGPATAGTMPIGEQYRWTYTTSRPEQARHRAVRALKRDHPAENPACWHHITPEEASNAA